MADLIYINPFGLDKYAERGAVELALDAQSVGRVLPEKLRDARALALRVEFGVLLAQL
jgi:hypothetical protein